MFVTKDEFLKGISEKERERYEESIAYHTAKSKREVESLRTRLTTFTTSFRQTVTTPLNS